MGQSHSINVTNENEVRQLQQKYNEQIEAEISLKNLQFAQERAVKLVELRERLAWEVIALGSMATLLLAAGSIYKRKDMAIPIAPIIMFLGYRYDLAYGTTQESIRDSADALLKSSNQQFEMVGGPIKLSDIDSIRKNYE